jgi:hypothetical protein
MMMLTESLAYLHQELMKMMLLLVLVVVLVVVMRHRRMKRMRSHNLTHKALMMIMTTST